MLDSLEFWREMTSDRALDAMLAEENRARALEVFDRLTPDPVHTDPIRTSIQSGQLDLRLTIAWLAEVVQPNRYLEIGVRRGFSLATLASGRPDATVFGFDMWMRGYAGVRNPGVKFVRQELDKVGYRGHATFISGDSHKTLPLFFGTRPPTVRERLKGRALRASGDDFDMVLVDGDHSTLGAYQDLVDVMPHIRPGGVLVFDDIAPDLSSFDEASLASVRKEMGPDPHGWGGLLGVWHAIQERFPNYKYFEFTQDSPGIAFAVRVD